MYADAEALLVAYLSTATTAQVSVETPADLLNELPFIRITRIGGSDDYITDTAALDVETYDTTRRKSSDMARQVHAAMMVLRNTYVNGVLVDTVETVTAPMWIDWEDENVQRYCATYNVSSRITAQS